MCIDMTVHCYIHLPSLGTALLLLAGNVPLLLGDVALLVGDAPLLVGDVLLFVENVPLLVWGEPLLVGDVPLLVGDVSLLVGDVPLLVGEVSFTRPQDKTNETRRCKKVFYIIIIDGIRATKPENLHTVLLYNIIVHTLQETISAEGVLHF